MLNTFIMLQINKCCSFETTAGVKMHKTSLTISNIEYIRNISAPNQHIRFISEGSCDSEGWGNDA